jgi:hypothetical protein
MLSTVRGDRRTYVDKVDVFGWLEDALQMKQDRWCVLRVNKLKGLEKLSIVASIYENLLTLGYVQTFWYEDGKIEWLYATESHLHVSQVIPGSLMGMVVMSVCSVQVYIRIKMIPKAL